MPINKTILITFVFDNNTVTIYTDDVVTVTQSFQNIHSIEPTATLWIGDPWHDNNGTIQIKGFTIYYGVLSSTHVANIYRNIEKGDPGAAGAQGAQGIKGDKGDPGTNGAAGINGINGQKGDPGTAGKDGTPGAKGVDGAAGKNGAAGAEGKGGAAGKDGQKGDPGIPGEKGEKGDRGVPGATNSKSALNPGAIIDKKIHRILTNNNTYAYCLGGTITCDDSSLDPITDYYKYGSTYFYKCSNDSQAYCLNGILESSDRAYLSPFPFSNSYRGFTVETKEQSPYIYDLGTNNIAYYSNQQFVASDDICNLLTDEQYLKNCNKPTS